MAFSVLFPLNVSAAGTTIYVDDDNTSGTEDGSSANPYNTIQEGINAASAGDTVYVKNGNYGETLSITKKIELKGEDRYNTVIDSSGTGTVVYINALYVNVTGFTIKSSSSNPGVYLNYAKYCNISGNEIISNGVGVSIRNDADNNIIYNNNISSNTNGITFTGGKWIVSENNIVSNNRISSSSGYGVYADGNTWSNVITNNEFDSNNYGIYLGSTYKFSIIDNDFISNTYGVYISSNTGSTWIYHNNFIGNTYQVYDYGSDYWDNGYPSGGNYWSDYASPDLDSDGVVDSPKKIYGCNIDHFPVTKKDGWQSITPGNSIKNLNTGLSYPTIQAAVDAASAGDTLSVKGGNVTATGYYYESVSITKSLTILGAGASNTTVKSWSCGGTAFNVQASNVKISGFTMRDSGNGVYLNYAQYSNISGNVIISNSNGIRFVNDADNNLVTNNVLDSNTNGITFTGGKWIVSENNIVSNNRISSSSGYGVYADGNTWSNVITNNEFESNNYGIYLGRTYKFSIIGNDFISNTYGVYISSNTGSTRIYHNNFIGNTYQAYDYGSNYWTNGYPDGGNYWDDYTGVDLYKGPGQNITGRDGIGDTPYVIDSNTRDHYPWMNPDGWLNQLPVADAGTDQVALVGEVVTFDGSGSYDPDGTIVSYAWDFGDSSTGTGAVTTHSYASEGNHTAILEVTDDKTATASDSVKITVITPTNAIQDLIDDILNMSLEFGIENSMVKKLENAIMALKNGQNETAKKLLESFINECEAQSGKKLTDVQAAYLIGKARWIANNL